MAKRKISDRDAEGKLSAQARCDLEAQLLTELQNEFHAACIGPWERMKPIAERIAARVARHCCP